MSRVKPSLLVAVSVSILVIAAYMGVVESRFIDDEADSLEKETQQLKRVLQTIQYQPKYRFTGSVYYRWGSSECGSNSELIYEGIVGGGYYSHAGAAVNALCLPRDPDLDELPPSKPRTYFNYLYGAEYEMGPNRDDDVPCAVCATPNRMKSLMIPAKRSCPKYWKKEYSGWLAAGYYRHAAASEYVCIDDGFAVDTSGYKNMNGKLFYYVQTKCGSLPCPKYDDKKIVTCVVCSK